MSPNKDWFETFRSIDGGSVLLGNKKSFNIMGIGTIRLKLRDGVERVLQQVRYIRELKRNLTSIRK